MDGLAVGFEDLEGAVVGFFGAVICLFAVEGALVFFGGNLGMPFFCSGIMLYVALIDGYCVVIGCSCGW